MRPQQLADTLKDLIKIKRTVTITGAPGGGKTSIVRDVTKSLGIAYVEQHIKDCYDEYIEKTLPRKIDLQLANTDIKVDSDTIH